MSRVRDNERYLAFSPAVSQAFLVHSGEVRHKIVGHEKVTIFRSGGAIFGKVMAGKTSKKNTPP
jgi:hypothetical protein